MNDMERRNFEDSLKDALNQGEVQPSERVWNSIEVDLIRAEAEKMKRRVFFYQMLAAASISFALLVAGLGFYAVNSTTRNNLAVITPSPDQQSLTQNAGKTSTRNEDTVTIAGSDKGNGDVASEISKPENSQQSSTRENDRRSAGRTEIRGGSKAIREDGTKSDNLKKPHDPLADNIAALERGEQNRNERSSSNVAAAEKNPGKEDLALTQPESGNIDFANASRAEANRVGIDNSSSSTEASATTADQDKGLQNNSITGYEERGRKLPRIVDSAEPVLVFEEEKSNADPVALMFARLNDLEKELANDDRTRKKEKSKERLWTSLAFAAGSFNAINPAGGSQTLQLPAQNFNSRAANSVAVENQTKASGVAYTVGISMGTQISERWVLQGGVNYLTEMSDYTSTQAVQGPSSFKAASINEIRPEGNDARERFIPTAPYTVNNSNEYVSVPLQAGYLIVKRKLSWQLNAGVSTDLFIQNTIDPEGNIEKSTSGAGDSSPFRSVNFSGLIGSELSYRLGDHYRLGINPGLRYPFNSVYKDDIGVESTPLTFDIGLRFRYIFN